jgi:hypothetical protein
MPSTPLGSSPEDQTDLGASTGHERSSRTPLVRGGAVTDPLKDGEQRRLIGLPEEDDALLPIVVELNLRHAEGLPGAESRFHEVYGPAIAGGVDRPQPEVIANTYVRCDLTIEEVRKLVQLDSANASPRDRAIYRVWPDFPVQALTGSLRFHGEGGRRAALLRGDGHRHHMGGDRLRHRRDAPALQGRTTTWAEMSPTSTRTSRSRMSRTTRTP